MSTSTIAALSQFNFNIGKFYSKNYAYSRLNDWLSAIHVSAGDIERFNSAHKVKQHNGIGYHVFGPIRLGQQTVVIDLIKKWYL